MSVHAGRLDSVKLAVPHLVNHAPTRCDPPQEMGSERAMKGRELMQFCWGAGSGSRHGAEPARACSYGGGVPRYVIAMAGNRIFKRHRTPHEWA